MLRSQIFYYPKERTFMKLIVLLGNSGQAGRAGELFETMVEEGIQPTSASYTALLAAYCRCNFLDEAHSILVKMKALPLCQPHAFTYSIFLKACVKSSRYELIDSLYHGMSACMRPLDTVNHNFVLGAYGKAGKLDEMEKLLAALLESDEFKPDARTMNTVLSSFGAMGETDVMESWYQKLCGVGIEPEAQTLNIMCGAYGRKRMYDKVAETMERMREKELPWTSSTYNSIIGALADAGDIQHMERAFDGMRAEGKWADANTFCHMITGYGNAGLFHKVVNSVKLAASLKITFSAPLYNAVMHACSKAGDLKEMEMVFNLMKGRNYMADSNYRKEGMDDKVYELDKERGRI